MAQADHNAAQAEVHRLSEAERARKAEVDRERAELLRREQESLMHVANANNLLYRLPAQALLRTIQAATISSSPDAAGAQALALDVLRKRWKTSARGWSNGGK